jgi:hypothetical protein
MTTLTAPANTVPAPSPNGAADPGPLQSAHAPNLHTLLRQLGASLLTTTYQAGNLVHGPRWGTCVTAATARLA